MATKLIVEPSEEPITLDELKDHLRVDGTEEDALIMAYGRAARRQCELISRRAFVTQTWELALECWPQWGYPQRSYIGLPYPPLQSVISISYVDSAGVTSVMPGADYVVDNYREPGRVILGYGKIWPSVTLRPGPSVIVRYVAGHGSPVVVPETYKQAIKLLAAHYYENREAVVIQAGAMATKVPLAVEALLMMDRGNW
jgi:uncharacterized phiE125 gp8 family phage protein